MRYIKQRITIGIIGFGRFGQLLAKHLKRFGPVFVCDKKNKIKEAVKIGVKFVDLRKTCEQEWVILAVPMRELEKALKGAVPSLKPGTILMDVCSVKVWPSQVLKKHAPKFVQIAATHPLFGPDSARESFRGHKLIFCPLRVSRENTDRLLVIFKKLGLNVIKATPEEHDKSMAVSQAIVHFIGRGLPHLKPKEIATPDYDRLLKMIEMVQNDTWELFYDMQRLNPYAARERRKYLKNLRRIEENMKRKFVLKTYVQQKS